MVVIFYSMTCGFKEAVKTGQPADLKLHSFHEIIGSAEKGGGN